VSGILFLLMLVAFVAIAYWAFTNDEGPDAGFKGLLAMTRDQGDEPSSSAARAPRWRQQRSTQDSVRDRTASPPPRWRREADRPR
jgi:hypothetical protein